MADGRLHLVSYTARQLLQFIRKNEAVLTLDCRSRRPLCGYNSVLAVSCAHDGPLHNAHDTLDVRISYG